MTVNGYELLVCPACGTERLRRSQRVAQPCQCGERVQAYELKRGKPLPMAGVTVGSGLAWVGEAAGHRAMAERWEESFRDERPGT